MVLIKKLLLCLLVAAPGCLWAALGVLHYRGEYFFTTYMAGGAVFIVFAVLAMFVLSGISWLRAARIRAALAVAGAVLFGWLATLPVMAILNLTPLCVGANNGDGVNDAGLCIGYVILYAVVFTPLILLGSIPLALIAAALPPGTHSAKKVKAL